MILLPAVCLVSYIFLAKQIFEEDKVAYVYTTGLNQAKSLSNRLEDQFKFFNFINKNIAEIIKNDGPRKLEKTRELLKFSDDIVALQVFEQESSQKTPQSIEQIVLNKELFEDKLSLTANDLKTKLSNQYQSINIVNGELGILSFNTKIEQTDRNSIFYTRIVFKNNEIIKEFLAAGIFQNYLIDQSGHAILGSPILNEKPIERFSNWNFFSKLITSKNLGGTFETQGPTKDLYFLSYKKVLSGNYTVLSFLKRSEAFKTTEILMANSYLFLLAALSIAFIISILSASKLTASLKKIYLASLEVGKGNFGIHVDIKSRDEVGQLAKSFNSMASEISKLLQKLQIYNEKLELMVQARTSELNDALQMQRAMVDSLGQGFFIFDNNGTILPVYSNASETMFEKSPKNENVVNLLYLTEEERRSFSEFLSQIFSEPIPFQDLIDMAPQSFQNKSGQKISLEYSPVRDEDDNGRIMGVVAVGTDRTDEVAAIELAQKERAYVQMIVKVLSNKNQFAAFLNESRQIIAEGRRSLEDENEIPQKLDSLFRYMHTMKGNAALFHLVDIQNLAHEYEDKVHKIKKMDSSVQDSQLVSLAQGLDEIENHFENFLKENSEVLGKQILDEEEKVVTLPISRIEKMHQILISSGAPKRIVKDFVENIYYSPASSMITHYSDLIQQLAADLEKKMAPLLIVGGETMVDPDHVSGLFSSLVHALRNSLDHGIENPEKRLSNGKSEEGLLKILVNRKNTDSGEHLNITIEDDGAGVNPEIIRQKSIEKELLSSEEAFAQEDAEIIQMIFHPGFSTQDAVSTLSGRGVGMDAIAEIVRNLEGTIRVYSVLGEGTTLEIDIPLEKSFQKVA